MTVCYLEVDDEITGAIGRIRAVTDGEAVIVVPPGAHIASSRINFKLLVKEAHQRRINVVAVSDDPGVRALAISAGLPAYDGLPAAEQALAHFREQDRKLAERLGRQPGEAPAVTETRRSASPGGETLILPSPFVEAPPIEGRLGTAGAGVAGDTADSADTAVLAPGEDATVAAEQPLNAPRSARRRGRPLPVAPLLALALLTLLVGGIAYGAYLLLPTAAITLQPFATELRLDPLTVTADASVGVTDVDEGLVPAERIQLPLRVSGEFNATGVDVSQTRSTGTVRFRSENTLNDIPVAQGTLVGTRAGIEFVTTRTVTIPRASFASGPSTIDVGVRALRAGPRSNVEAGSITQLPESLAAQLVSVTNREPTTGGRRVEQASVAEADFEAALAELDSRLDTALAEALANPGSTPRGLTLFPTTAIIGQKRPDPIASVVVGTSGPTFTLALEAVATVVAVNESLVDELAATRLRRSLRAGQLVVGDRVAATRTAGRASGSTVTYEVVPSALVYSEPDRAALLAAVRGKTLEEARAILAAHGTVEISLWPEFVDRLPEQAARINLTIVPPAAQAGTP